MSLVRLSLVDIHCQLFARLLQDLMSQTKMPCLVCSRESSLTASMSTVDPGSVWATANSIRIISLRMEWSQSSLTTKGTSIQIVSLFYPRNAFTVCQLNCTTHNREDGVLLRIFKFQSISDSFKNGWWLLNKLSHPWIVWRHLEMFCEMFNTRNTTTMYHEVVFDDSVRFAILWGFVRASIQPVWRLFFSLM